MGEKSILILGSKHIAALEVIYSREFSELGIRNQVLGIQDKFLKYYNKSLINKVIYRIGFSRIINEIQSDIKVVINKFQPTIVLIFKGMEIEPRTLKWIKTKGILILNYNPDNPFLFTGRGSGNRNVTNSIRLYDLYITYNQSVVSELFKKGVESRTIPFAYDCGGFVFEEIKKDEEINKLCFLGNCDKFRKKFIVSLSKKGIPVDVYGENWKSLKSQENITVYGPKYGDDFWKTLQRYSVQLNLLRPHNLNSHNMRSFDILGAGGIMVAPKSLEHELFFLNFKGVRLFADFNEAIIEINKILNMSFEERISLRRNTRMKVMREHTYRHRVEMLLSMI
jgi:spore maturation protein CgeB